jgi:hypothetical protein
MIRLLNFNRFHLCYLNHFIIHPMLMESLGFTVPYILFVFVFLFQSFTNSALLEFFILLIIIIIIIIIL